MPTATPAAFALKGEKFSTAYAVFNFFWKVVLLSLRCVLIFLYRRSYFGLWTGAAKRSSLCVLLVYLTLFCTCICRVIPALLFKKFLIALTLSMTHLPEENGAGRDGFFSLSQLRLFSFFFMRALWYQYWRTKTSSSSQFSSSASPKISYSRSQI